MKGKLKRIMALALGVVTCFMSIAPNVAYAADGSDTGPVEVESMNFLRDDFEEYQQTIPNNPAIDDIIRVKAIYTEKQGK